MTVIVIGSRGLIGSAVVTTLIQRGIQHRALCSPSFSLGNPDQVRSLPINSGDCIINCAGYTQVDACDQHYEQALNLNVDQPFSLAQRAYYADARYIHISSDYVFSGSKDPSSGYQPTDATSPINAYGLTKKIGEDLIKGIPHGWSIVRTSWVYGARPEFFNAIDGTGLAKDFVETISAKAHTGERATVVSDQIGSPTYVNDIAGVLVDIAQQHSGGIEHYSGLGPCSWYDYAREIYRLRGADPELVTPISSAELPPKSALRPLYSYLETSVGTPIDWRERLAQVLAEL